MSSLCAGMELSEALQRGERKRATWQTGSRQEEEMYRGMIASLEERQSHLVCENSELRQCLRFMQQELTSTLSATAPSSSPTSARTQLSDRNDDVTTELDDNMSESDALSEGLYGFPVYVFFNDVISSHVFLYCSALRASVRRRS